MIKKSVLSTIAFIIIVVAILSGIGGLSYAIYKAYIKSYTKFDVATFSASIYGEETGSPNQFNAFGDLSTALQTLSENLQPGMVKDTSQGNDTAFYFPFNITNWTVEKDGQSTKTIVAGTKLEYEIRIRTSGNLPLNYYIVTKPHDPEIGFGEYGGTGDNKYDYPLCYAGSPSEIDVAEVLKDKTINGEKARSSKWYEYCFYKDLADKSSEFKFPLTNDGQQYNEHYLVVEWPTTTEVGGQTKYNNIAKYMQEMDTIQIFVSVYNYDYDDDPKNKKENPDYYGKGFILLRDPDKPQLNSYDLQYSVSFGAFHQISGFNGYNFEFSVDNGVDLGLNPNYISDDYTIKVKIPVMKETYMYDVDLKIYDYMDVDGNGITTEYIDFDREISYSYELNIKGSVQAMYESIYTQNQYDAYVKNLTSATPVADPNKGYMLFKVYSFKWNKDCVNGKKVDDDFTNLYKNLEIEDEAIHTLINKTNVDGTWIKKDSFNKYILTISNSKGSVSTSALEKITEGMTIQINCIGNSGV